MPGALTSFIGRDDTIEALGNLLDRARLVTLTGFGGVGKTRLAVETARRTALAYSGGVWMVDLAPVRDPDLVTTTVARVLGVAEQGGQELVDVLADAVANRLPTLLVLDNCEHLVGACAELVARLLQESQKLRVLITSREALGIDGEVTFPVAPLGVPAGQSAGEEAARSDAVRLFDTRARAVSPAFSLDAGSLDAVTAICRRLDGLPLAIELAASQVRVLELAQIATRLDDRFALLQRPHGRTDRHRSLLAAVEWSHELLTEDARWVFARLAVFAGSFTLNAAEAVCGGNDVLAAVTELVDKSLLVREPTGKGVARYRLLETLRVYALEQLVGTGDEHETRLAHFRFYQELARDAVPHLDGPDHLAWRWQLDAEEHEFDAALDWSRAHEPLGGLRLAVSLEQYWYVRYQTQKGVAAVITALEATPEAPPSDRAWALASAARLSTIAGDARDAPGWAEEAITLFRRTGERGGEATAQCALAHALYNRGQLDRADLLFRAAIETLDDLGDAEGALQARYFHGWVALQRGDYELADTLYSECLAGWTRRGVERGRARTLRMFGTVARYRGDLDAARAYCEQSLAVYMALDDAPSQTHVRSVLGDLMRLSGDWQRAQEVYEEVLGEFRGFGDRQCTASTLRNLGVLASARLDHEEAIHLFLDAMTVRHELGDDTGVGEVLEGLAAVIYAQGDPRAAAVLVSAAQSLRQAGGVTPAASDRQALDELLANIRGDLDEQAFSVAWGEGSALDADAATQQAGRIAATFRRSIQPDRRLATVLFTDIVGSTQHAVQQGDRSWRELLDRHDAMVRAQLRRFGGDEMQTTGDGFFAIFDSPGQAMRCATAIESGAGNLGVEVRAGLHTGEVERRGRLVSGIAVHIAQRVSALAGPGEVLVSRTVADLVAGSGIKFADRGEHELKGVPGSWRVFAVEA